MRKSSNKQRGFGLVSVLLVIVVLGIIGATGWFVYQRNRTQSSSAVPNTNQSTSQSTNPSNSNPEKSASPESYLEIKEWGVKLPLPASVKDAYYTVVGSSTDGEGRPNTAWIGLTSLNDKGCNVAKAGPSSTDSPVGSIIRVAPTDRHPVTGALYTEQNPGGITLDGYYYAYIPWKNTKCGSQGALQAFHSALADANKGLSRAAAAN